MSTTEKTKKILEKIIEKPRITVALLERPPFKFIVDIVANVIESTGFLKKEFSKEDLQNAGKDKESKIQLLEKLIKILDTDGSLKNVKATKIVSGVEAEETNKMLQKLGSDAKKFRSSEIGEKKKEKKTKTEENGEEKKKKKKEKEGEEKPKKRSRSETKESSEDKKKKSSSKDRHKSSDKKEKSSSKKLEKQDSKSEKILNRQDSMDVQNEENPEESPKPDENNDDEGFGDEPEAGIHTFELPPKVEKEEDPVINPSDMPPLIRPMTGAAGGRPMTSMGRPGTASSRPAPPKLKKKQIATVDSTPQVVVELKSEILTDSIPKLNLEENDDNFIIEDDENDGDRTIRLSDYVEEEDRGALVQKIMDTKAGIEEGGLVEDVVEDSGGITVEKEKVKQLQEKLQDLTRSAYPLARMFDFANDDIESMVKEMERWRTEQRKNEQEEQNRRATGHGDSSRLYTIINNLHKEIREMKEELGRAKGRVLHNEKKIQFLISNI